MRRVTSTPEIRRLHESSLSRNFPMQISEISNLETHHEHEHDDEEEGIHGVDECEDHNKEGNPSRAVENTPTEHTVEEDPDDFGFFNIDDEDENNNNDKPTIMGGGIAAMAAAAAQKKKLKKTSSSGSSASSTTIKAAGGISSNDGNDNEEKQQQQQPDPRAALMSMLSKRAPPVPDTVESEPEEGKLCDVFVKGLLLLGEGGKLYIQILKLFGIDKQLYWKFRNVLYMFYWGGGGNFRKGLLLLFI